MESTGKYWIPIFNILEDEINSMSKPSKARKQIKKINIGLASVVSDPFGKTASNIMKEVMKSNVIDDDKILKLVHKNCKNKDKILDSLHGYRIESDQRFMRSGID